MIVANSIFYLLKGDQKSLSTKMEGSFGLGFVAEGLESWVFLFFSSLLFHSLLGTRKHLCLTMAFWEGCGLWPLQKASASF